MDRANPRIFTNPPPPEQTVMRCRRTWPPGVPEETSVDDGLVVPTTVLQIELPELRHVDGAQPKAPSSGVSARLIAKPPLDILETEGPKQDFVAIAQQVLARRCCHDRTGNRGVAIAVVVSMSWLVNECRTQGELEAVGGPIDRIAYRIIAVLEP